MAGGHPAGGWPEAARKFSLSVCLSSIPQRYISAVYRYPGTGDLTQFVRGVLIESERHRACESDFTEAIRSSPTFTRPDSIKTIKPIEFSGSLAKYRRKKYPAPRVSGSRTVPRNWPTFHYSIRVGINRASFTRLVINDPTDNGGPPAVSNLNDSIRPAIKSDR